MKWWQKKVKGWVVPFWYTDTPLYSKRFAELSEENKSKVADAIRGLRRGEQKTNKPVKLRELTREEVENNRSNAYKYKI
jgi:hypothetical protein